MIKGHFTIGSITTNNISSEFLPTQNYTSKEKFHCRSSAFMAEPGTHLKEATHATLLGVKIVGFIYNDRTRLDDPQRVRAMHRINGHLYN